MLYIVGVLVSTLEIIRYSKDFKDPYDYELNHRPQEVMVPLKVIISDLHLLASLLGMFYSALLIKGYNDKKPELYKPFIWFGVGLC